MSTQRNFPGAGRRRPPAKQRGQRKCCHQTSEANRSYDQPDPLGFSAPSHMGGQFEEHGYGSGHGPIGFTQHVLP